MPFMLVLLAINAYAALVGIVVIAVLMKLQKQNEKHLEARLQALRLAQIRSLAALISDPQLRNKSFESINQVESEANMEQVFEEMPQRFVGAIMQYGFDGVTREAAMQLLQQIKKCPEIQLFGNVPYIERRVWLDEKERCVKVEYEQVERKVY